VRAVIDEAATVHVVTPTLPGRGNVMSVIADAVAEFQPDQILLALRSSQHADWQERRLIEHIEQGFVLPLTT
jgi:hypothetical protein